MFHFFSGLNRFTPKSDLIHVDFTLSNARRFYSSKGDPLGVKLARRVACITFKLMQRTLKTSIKENLLAKECSCSSKTNEKQMNREMNRETHLRVISDLSK